MPILDLNSQSYVARQTGFNRHKKDVFAPVFAQTGGQVQQDIIAYGTEVLGPWIHGIGRTAIPVGADRDSIDHQMYQDGFVDARFPTGVYAGLLLKSIADTNLERVTAFADFKGQLEAMWTNTDSPVDIMSIQYDAGTPDWDKANGADILTNTGSDNFTGLDMVPFKEKLVALFGNDNSHSVFHSTDTITWTVASTPIATGLLSGVSTNEDIDAGKFQEIGGRLAAVLWHETAGTVTVYSSIDSAVWKDEVIEVASGGGVKGVAKVRAPDRLDHLIFCTREGLQDVDVSAGTGSYTITSIDSPLSASDDNGRNMVNHNGELWYSQGVSTSDVFQVWRMFVGGNGDWVHEPVEGSPHLRDGLPTDMLGTVTAMASSGGFCYIAVGGGAASRNATIFCHNGFGWHPIVQLATANRIIHTMAVSSESDGVVRLHFDEKAGTADSEPYIVENINSHPSSGVSIPRAGTSQLALPFVDGGLPTQNKIWMMIRAKVDDLGTSTSATHIPVTYGKDGEARTVNTTLFNGITADGTHDTNDFYSNAKELSYSEDSITNGTFSSDTGWTKNSWTISGNVANSASAQSTTLSQTPTLAVAKGLSYEVVFDVVSQSAGTVTVSVGGTDGTARSTQATFNETIVAGETGLLEFKAAGFTGTIDNVTMKQVSEADGAQSVAMGLELTLTQTTPATPVLQALELIFKATSTIIEEWDFEIDISATEQDTGVDYETIVTNLQSAESNSVLVPLTYGQLGTKYVSVDRLEFRPVFSNDGASMSGAAADEFDLRTGGTVLLTVSQVVT